MQAAAIQLSKAFMLLLIITIQDSVAKDGFLFLDLQLELPTQQAELQALDQVLIHHTVSHLTQAPMVLKIL
jgi:hypothetical protein